MNFTKRRSWLRYFAAEAETGSAAATTPPPAGQGAPPAAPAATETPTAPPVETAPGGATPAAVTIPEGDSFTREQVEKLLADAAPKGEETDTAGRGSKREVLSDLAKERDKRQAAEADLAEAKKATAELETLTTERDKLLEKVAEYEQAAQKNQREADIKAALAESKLPAEMADRLRGTTPEELLADAKKLAADLGYDRRPADPFQGTGTGGKTTATSLGGAIGAHYANS